MEDTNAEVVVARKRIEDEKDSNGFIYMCRDMCCCCRPRCRRNDSEPGESKNSASSLSSWSKVSVSGQC